MSRILIIVFSALSALLCSRLALQYYQLESYQMGGYGRTMRRNGLRALLPGAVSAAVGAVISLIFLPAACIVQLAAAFGMYFVQRKAKAKKPLVITARVKRLIGIMLAVNLICAWAVCSVTPLWFCLLLPLFSPVLLAVSAVIALPMEKLIQRMYLWDAMKKLDSMKGLIKIGITGSFGKTSCKFMLESILSEKYRVLVTPASFNTSMGVTRIIRERLKPDHQVFVAEMGSRHPGDIRLLCKLVRPHYGIITSVGPQHLETFHTQEAICKEKFELACWIKEDGAMVFASDGGLCQGLYEKAKCPKHLSGQEHKGMGLYAKQIEVGPWGSRFLLCDGEREVPCQTRLLGQHNIGNLLAACTLARVLGLDLETIARGAGKCKPVEHRLQLLESAGGATIIDDAFNSNPVGASHALDVLSSFKTGRRIIITPGFVELGSKEAEYNHALGEKIAQCADIVILVGRKHTAPIAQGIREQGFDENALHIVSSLEESTALLGGMLRAGDVVLYENDLPDNYQE